MTAQERERLTEVMAIVAAKDAAALAALGWEPVLHRIGHAWKHFRNGTPGYGLKWAERGSYLREVAHRSPEEVDAALDAYMETRRTTAPAPADLRALLADGPAAPSGERLRPDQQADVLAEGRYRLQGTTRACTCARPPASFITTPWGGLECPACHGLETGFVEAVIDAFPEVAASVPAPAPTGTAPQWILDMVRREAEIVPLHEDVVVQQARVAA